MESLIGYFLEFLKHKNFHARQMGRSHIKITSTVKNDNDYTAVLEVISKILPIKLFKISSRFKTRNETLHLC